MEQRKHKRRKYIVDNDFQYGLIRKFAVITAFIVAGSLSFLVLVFYKYGDMQIDIVQPYPFDLSECLKNIENITSYSLLSLLWPVLSICLFGTIIFTIVFSVIISHRMAGPVYRMRMLLSSMAQGDLSSPVSSLRRKDEFKHLFTEIHKVKEYWRSQIQELQWLCQEPDGGGNQAKRLNRICEIVSTFKTKIK